MPRGEAATKPKSNSDTRISARTVVDSFHAVNLDLAHSIPRNRSSRAIRSATAPMLASLVALCLWYLQTIRCCVRRYTRLRRPELSRSNSSSAVAMAWLRLAEVIARLVSPRIVFTSELMDCIGFKDQIVSKTFLCHVVNS